MRREKGERGIWQRRYWEHYIRDERDHRTHIAYCYYNPAKHGLVGSIRDWPHSTYHRDVRVGRFEADWKITDAPDSAFGERDADDDA